MSSRCRKVVIALATGLFFYALSDILLWQRIFEAHDLFQFDAQYQSGHVTTLVAFIGIGIVLLWDAGLWALWYAAAFYTLAFSGLEDALYYWLDGRGIPAALPWLDGNGLIPFRPVTSTTLLLSVALWVGLWTVSLLVLEAWRPTRFPLERKAPQPSPPMDKTAALDLSDPVHAAKAPAERGFSPASRLPGISYVLEKVRQRIHAGLHANPASRGDEWLGFSMPTARALRPKGVGTVTRCPRPRGLQLGSQLSGVSDTGELQRSDDQPAVGL